MAKYKVNRAAVRHCRDLIRAGKVVLDSEWGAVQPDADSENAFLEEHGWDEYPKWFLGLTEGANDETKARHAFAYGDFTKVHRSGLIAASTAPPSGGTRTSSSPPTGCCRSSTRRTRRQGD